MHPDERVDIALQDLRSPSRSAAVARVSRHRPPSLAARAIRWFFAGWAWYARETMAAPMEPHLPHRIAHPLRVNVRRGRWTVTPGRSPRFALLFGRAAAPARR
jgi:hypothetical protein